MVEYQVIKSETVSDFSSLENQFLIAMPQMEDPNFAGSLTYICEHNEEGAMGIVINRPTQYGIAELLNQLDITIETDIPAEANAENGSPLVYAGGPVQRERGFILHDGDKVWKSTLKLSPTLKLTTSLDILEAIAVGEGPERYLVALGYAGWGKGQLEGEIVENTWLTCPVQDEIVFGDNDNVKLKKAMSSLGIQMGQLSAQSGHA